MIELRVSEAAGLLIVEQADYYLEAADLDLAERWEEAVDQAIHSLLNCPERVRLAVSALHRLQGCVGYSFQDLQSTLSSIDICRMRMPF